MVCQGFGTYIHTVYIYYTTYILLLTLSEQILQVFPYHETLIIQIDLVVVENSGNYWAATDTFPDLTGPIHIHILSNNTQKICIVCVTAFTSTFLSLVSVIHGRASSNKTGRSFLVGDADCLDKIVPWYSPWHDQYSSIVCFCTPLSSLTLRLF